MCHPVLLYNVIYHLQEGDSVGRRIAMDGNLSLVRRTKAGHSVRAPLHEGRFFLPQAEVDEFVDKQGSKTSPEDQVCL